MIWTRSGSCVACNPCGATGTGKFASGCQGLSPGTCEVPCGLAYMSKSLPHGAPCSLALLGHSTVSARTLPAARLALPVNGSPALVRAAVLIACLANTKMAPALLTVKIVRSDHRVILSELIVSVPGAGCEAGQYRLGCAGSSPGVCTSCTNCTAQNSYKSGCAGLSSGQCSSCT